LTVFKINKNQLAILRSPSRGGAPGYIKIAPLGLARGDAPGYIKIAPLGLARGDAPGYINIAPLGLIINH